MESRLKQRLVGAAVLVALAVIFLPMLVQGPAPDSGVSDVPLAMPDAPRADYETRDLPLVAPANTPEGGAVGMPSAPPATASTVAPAAVVAEAPPSASSTSSVAPSTTPDTVPAPSPVAADLAGKSAEPALPATVAAGDYAVSFGTYASTAAADAVIASLRKSQLPGFREAATANGKPAWRVRIGPYASRADAEIARLRASHVRDDVGARVVTLDAAAPTPTTAGTTATKTATAATAPTAATKPPSVPSGTGFALQLAAYSKSADALALRDKLRAAGFSAFTESVATDKGALTRVRVGPVLTHAEADQLKVQVKSRLGLDGIVRPHP